MDRLINDAPSDDIQVKRADTSALDQLTPLYGKRIHIDDLKEIHLEQYTEEELNQFYRVYLENGYNVQAIEDAKLYCKYRDILTIEQMEELRGLLNRLPHDLHSLESRNYEIDYNGRFARQMLEHQKCQIMGRENWKNPMDIPEIRAAVEWFDCTYKIKLDRNGIFMKYLL